MFQANNLFFFAGVNKDEVKARIQTAGKQFSAMLFTGENEDSSPKALLLHVDCCRKGFYVVKYFFKDTSNQVQYSDSSSSIPGSLIQGVVASIINDVF